MLIRKGEAVLDVDLDASRAYAQTHSLCDCDECRNFYAQARDRLPELTAFLSELGVLIERPDEIASVAEDGAVQYLFVAYTVNGEILEFDQFETDLWDGDLMVSITIDNRYVPNEQASDRYFTVTVFNLVLPWVLDEPFPVSTAGERITSVFEKIKAFFKRK